MAPNIHPGPIEGRRLSRLPAIVAWTGWLIALILAIIGIVSVPSSGTVDLIGLITGIAATLASVTLVTSGAVLMTRLRRNPIGWLLWVGGILLAFSLGTGPIDQYLVGASSPGAVWLAWLNNLAWTPAIVALVAFVPLLFPTGHLPSPRWRVVVIATIIALIGSTLQTAFSPFAPGNTPPGLENPLALSGMFASMFAVFGAVTTIIAVVCLPLVVVSLVIRYRRAPKVERQQLKWFAAVAGIMVPAFVVVSVTSGATGGVASAAWFVIMVGLALLPVAIGIAVLRYRLYEIDRLISRTLAYGALAALLSATYVGSVLLLSSLLSPLTSRNSLAVAGSTLLVAALFRPVRDRLKAAVDRRFFRSGYDAARELAAFGSRLRDQIEINELRAEIAGTVERLVQPGFVSLWLRELPEPGELLTVNLTALTND